MADNKQVEILMKGIDTWKQVAPRQSRDID